MNKKTFLKNAAFAGLGGMLSFDGLAQTVKNVSAMSLTELAKDEDFWASIRKGYKLKPDYINFENGYYNFLPEQVLEKFIEHVREVNYHGSYYMRNFQAKTRKSMAAKLATGAGCSADELIITRNTTESLDLIISGLDWNAGDEAIMAEQDYGSMRNMFIQVSKRYGVINKVLSVPNIPQSDEEIVNLYESAITDKTKLLIINSPQNPTGAITDPMHLKEIYDLALKHDLYIYSDEIYSRMVYEEKGFFSIASLDQAKERVILSNGFSKAFAMTGWRLGSVIAPPVIAERMMMLLQTTSSCVSAFVQRAGIAAIEGAQAPVDAMMTEYKSRRDLLVEGLNAIPGISCHTPGGAFYAFPNISSFVRLVYASSTDNIIKALERIASACKKL